MIEMRRDVSGFMTRWDPELAAYAKELGDWPDRTVAEFAKDCYLAHPDRIQIVDNGTGVSCGRIYETALRLAGYFETAGLVPGDVISFQLPNWWEANAINMAAAMVGVVVNPIVPINRDAEVTYMLNACGTKIMFIPGTFRKFDYAAMMDRIKGNLDRGVQTVVVRGSGETRYSGFEEIVSEASPIPELRQVDPNAVKMLLFTSGTTGRPKGVLHSHNSIHADGRKMVPAMALTEQDTTFSPSPVTHVSGYLWVLNVPWLADIPAVTVDVWDRRQAFELLERFGCSFALGATPFLQDLVAEAKWRNSELPRLRQYLCGGAAVPPSLIYEAARQFPNCIPWRNFGASEVTTMTRGPATRDDLAAGAETDGRLHHCKVKIVDLIDGMPVPSGSEGEVLSWEPSMAIGYARAEDNEAAYDEDGYFRMGDVGRIVDEDHLLITGRKKDLIIRSGENISPKEIEDALIAAGIVSDVAVVSKPSAATGEAICAFVVPLESGPPSLAEVSAVIAKAGLAKQKTPEHLLVIDEIPRTASGKIRKDVLRDIARGDADRGSIVET